MIMSDLLLEEIVELGVDGSKGNLLGIQPYLTTADYASEEAFFTQLESYMQAADQKGWINEQSVVIFPEMIGTWLVVADAGDKVLRAPTLSEAMRPLVMKHLLPFLGALITSPEKDRMTASVLRMNAKKMAGLYQSVFSRLAKQYRVTVVAGSIVLPAPRVKNGRLEAGNGPLYNTAAVFAPNGKAHPGLARKSFPIAGEIEFTAPAPLSELPVFETPAGRLGVAICADSWYPQVYDRLKEVGVEFIAIPSLATGMDIWDKPWGGYVSATPPQDVDGADVGRITEGQAWLKYAMTGRIERSGTRIGINVFLHGQLWDLGANNGNSVAVKGDEFVEIKKNGGALLNLWL
jgi:predicted amidohydrolase